MTNNSMSLVFINIMVMVVIAEQGVCTDGFLRVDLGFMGRTVWTFLVIATLAKCYLALAAPIWLVGMEPCKLINGHAGKGLICSHIEQNVRTPRLEGSGHIHEKGGVLK